MEDGEETKSHADEPDHGRDPVDALVGGPAKDEKPTGEEDRADHHWREAGFGDRFVVVLLEFTDVKFVVARTS